MAGETGGGMMGGMGGGGGMDWIGAIVGGISSWKTAYSSNKQTQEMYDRWRRYYDDAMKLLTAKKIMKTQSQLFPAMRSAVQYQVGQNYEKDVTSSLSNAGLLNSPTGTALLDAAKAMPDQIAGSQSLDRAIELNKMQSQIKMAMANGSTAFKKLDVRTEAGLGAARGMGAGQPAGSSAGNVQSDPAAYQSMFNAAYSPSQAPSGYGAMTSGAKTGYNGQNLYNYGGGGSWINSFGWIK